MFEDRLKKTRKAMGLTQAKFAKLGGVGVTAQCTYEKGTRVPPAKYLQQLLSNDIDIVYLLSGKRAAIQGVPDFDRVEKVATLLFRWSDQRKPKPSPEQRGAVLKQLLELTSKNTQEECEATTSELLELISVLAPEEI